MSAILTTQLKIELAQSVATQPLFVAWGRGDPLWETTITETLAVQGSTYALTHYPASSLVLTSPDDSVTYVDGTDYTVDPATGFIVPTPSAGIPDNADVKATYYRVTPIADPTATALLDVVAYRQASEVAYVVPDENGAIETDLGSFTLSLAPTRWVYVRAQFDKADAVGETIRELAIMKGTLTDGALPAGQTYFSPAQVTEGGAAIALDNLAVAEVRTSTVRLQYEFVLEI